MQVQILFIDFHLFLLVDNLHLLIVFGANFSTIHYVVIIQTILVHIVIIRLFFSCANNKLKEIKHTLKNLI